MRYSSFANFVETTRYSGDSLILDDMLSTLRCKLIESGVHDVVVQVLIVKMGKKKPKKDKDKDKTAHKGKPQPGDAQTDEPKKFKCFYCHKE